MISYWLHGWATDRRVFASLTGRLTDQLRGGAVSLDLPGFGQEGPLSAGETYAGRIVSEIERNTCGQDNRGVVLAGWSLGTLVALEAADALGKDLSALVLISACARFSLSRDNPYGTDPRRMKLMIRRLERERPEVLEEFFSSMFEPRQKELWERFQREFLTSQGSGGGKKWTNYLDQAQDPLSEGLHYLAQVDLAGILGKITAPVLIIHGGKDRVIDIRLARDLEKKLSDARLVVIKNAGHMPFMGKEDEVAEVIGDFLSTAGEQ